VGRRFSRPAQRTRSVATSGEGDRRSGGVLTAPARPDAEYDAVMRTTIDLPEDVHQAAVLVARDRHQTLSRAVSDLLRSALAGQGGSTAIEIDDETGLPLVRLRRRITAEDVASAQDDS